MHTGSVIKLLRTAKGVSQGSLAERIEVTRAYLSAIENNHKQPSLALLKKVSGALNVPTALLLAGEVASSEQRHIADELMSILSNLLAASVKAQEYREKEEPVSKDENETPTS